jgi:hypothetical protein
VITLHQTQLRGLIYACVQRVSTLCIHPLDRVLVITPALATQSYRFEVDVGPGRADG